MTEQAANTPKANPKRPARPRGVLCPYCGRISADLKRCDSCRAFFDPLSRQATQNAMGPWFIRDEAHPFRPGCSFDTIRQLIARARITHNTILRGPTTRQCWSFASRTPSVANLLGICHNCQKEVNPDEFSCRTCGAVFAEETDRQHLGLAPVHLLPGQATPERIAAASSPGAEAQATAALVGQEPDNVSTPPERDASSRLRALVVVLGVLAVVLGGALLFVLRDSWVPLLTGDPSAPPVVTEQPVAAASAPSPEASRTPPEQPPETPVEPPITEPPPAPAAPVAITPPDPALAPAGAFSDSLLPLLLSEPFDPQAAHAALAVLADRYPASTREIQVWSGLIDRRAERSRLSRLH